MFRGVDRGRLSRPTPRYVSSHAVDVIAARLGQRMKRMACFLSTDSTETNPPIYAAIFCSAASPNPAPSPQQSVRCKAIRNYGHSAIRGEWRGKQESPLRTQGFGAYAYNSE